MHNKTATVSTGAAVNNCAACVRVCKMRAVKVKLDRTAAHPTTVSDFQSIQNTFILTFLWDWECGLPIVLQGFVAYL